MKNLLKKAMLFAAAAMAFVSCQNDTTGDETIKVPGFEVSVNATTSEVARSAFGDYNSTDKTYPTFWEGNEAWWIGVNDKYAESVKTITFSENNTAASAKFEFTEAPAAVNGTYTLYAVSPASTWSSYDLEKDYLRFYIARNTQTPTATSCDPASQVLLAKSEAMESADAFSVNFEHLSAYIKFSFVNVAEGGVVNSVSIASENVDLAGRYQYTPSTGKIAPYDRLEKSITLVTESHENLWVSVAPVDLSGKKLTFSITTDKGILSKEVTMPATAKLESGKVVTFNVDMAGIEYPSAEAGEEWQLVTATADLEDGEYIIVGKSQDGNVVYLPSTTTSSAPSQKVISVPGLDLTSTASFNTTLIPEDARFTFSGSASAMTIKNADGKSLYTTNDNNGVRVGSTTGTWVIAKNTNNANALTLKFSTTSRYITLYKSQDWRSYTSIKEQFTSTTGADQNGVTFIYKKLSKDPAISVETISVPATGATGEASYTIKNMETDDVTATFATEWISAEVVNGKIAYEVEPNYTGAARTGKITLASATYGITKDVTVSQAADVFKVSATSVSLKADANSTATFTVTSTYAATLAVSDSAKWSINPTTVAGSASAVTITVTAKTANEAAEAVAGVITVTRTEDSKKLTVNLSQAVAEQGGGDEGGSTEKVWTLVTDASTLKAGDQIIIASNAKGLTASATITSNYMATVATTFSSDKKTITSVGSGTAILTLGGSAGAWTLTNESGKKLGATAVKKVAWGSGTTTWTITISSNNATIQNTNSSYGRFLHNVSSPRFTTYTSNTSSSMLLPQIYRLQ